MERRSLDSRYAQYTYLASSSSSHSSCPSPQPPALASSCPSLLPSLVSRPGGFPSHSHRGRWCRRVVHRLLLFGAQAYDACAPGAQILAASWGSKFWIGGEQRIALGLMHARAPRVNFFWRGFQSPKAVAAGRILTSARRVAHSRQRIDNQIASCLLLPHREGTQNGKTTTRLRRH